MFLVMVATILLIGARRNLSSSTSSSTVALAAVGLVMYALGGLTWNVDNHFCRRLGQIRSPYGPLPPAARPLTQLHAWWHLFSGMGTYLLLLAGLTMRLRCVRAGLVWKGVSMQGEYQFSLKQVKSKEVVALFCTF